MHGHLCLCLNHGKFLGMFGAGSVDDLLQLLHAVAPRHQLACAKNLRSQCQCIHYRRVLDRVLLRIRASHAGPLRFGEEACRTVVDD
jgi:hypothetical protein